jgi:3-hydroxy-9,10-secoandrosta-1,3,5(10)-triene-9,17-dione monooxygenase reductase component
VQHPHGEATARHYRNVLGHFATGVTVVTALDHDGAPVGMTVNSFTSVSLDPPLVLFCIGDRSSSWPAIRAAGHVGVNILGYADRPVCARMATPSGPDRFRDVTWSSSPGGAPIHAGAVAWLDGTVHAAHPAGDHTIVVVCVHHYDTHNESPPLVFLRGNYGTFTTGQEDRAD